MRRKQIRCTREMGIVLAMLSCIVLAFGIQFYLKSNYADQYVNYGEVMIAQEENYYDADSGFEYVIREDEAGEKYIVTSGYKGNVQHVVIPKSIQGIPVKEIGEQSFLYQENIETIEVPNSIIKISNFSIGSCRRLKQIIIPASVQTIEEYAILVQDQEIKSMKDILIITEENSAAVDYAEKKKLKIEHMKK